MMFDLLVIGVLCLFFAKLKRTAVAKQRWRELDTIQRQRTVRNECAFRTVGRFVGACGLVIDATLVSPCLGIIWLLAAVRVVKPVRAEMREACEFHSTGARDEPPYSW